MIGPRRAFATVSRVFGLLWCGPARVELHRSGPSVPRTRLSDVVPGLLVELPSSQLRRP